MKRELICINCPRGCHLSAERPDENTPWKITGYSCPAGLNYAQNELTTPKRVVTAVIRTNDINHPWLPVRTDKVFPKEKIADLLNRIYKMTVSTPLKMGDVILADIDGTGVNLIASENL